MASAQTTTAPDKTASDKAAAYYNFAMGHLYAEQAGQFGNRSEYVNKAIDHYRQALKLDPSAGYIFEELTDLYIQTGHIRDAVTEAQDMLKHNPDNLDARRILGRIYTRMIGERSRARSTRTCSSRRSSSTSRSPRATPKTWKAGWRWAACIAWRAIRWKPRNRSSTPSRSTPNSEEALTGLAMVYSDIGDTKKADRDAAGGDGARSQPAHARSCWRSLTIRCANIRARPKY